MGGIFGAEKEFTPSFFLDFENAQPTDSEKEVYNQVQLVVGKHTGIMEKMRSYKGNDYFLVFVKRQVLSLVSSRMV